jgi:hypothetical protein
MQGKK